MKKIIVLAFGMALAGMAFAGTNQFGWQKGKSAQVDRSNFFSKTGSFKTEAEREAYFEKNGIGGDGPYHDAEHYDVEKLLADGIVTQEQADKIKSDASAKHEAMDSKFAEADFENMTKKQIAEFYNSIKN